MTPFVLSGQDILLSSKSLRSYQRLSSLVLFALLQTVLRKHRTTLKFQEVSI